MYKKGTASLLLIAICVLTGCNGIGVLLNPPRSTGYYTQTKPQTAGETPYYGAKKKAAPIMHKMSESI
ncbi:hypothetical protein ACJK9F_003697 [Lelliottia nimipressuralis]|uniref:hypothetical protein n=1 Tax=Lelliottia nimipressuralis TaxID=69220 RepID=UPI003906AF00